MLIKMWLACGCIRRKDIDAGTDPQAAKQRCRQHGQQVVLRWEPTTVAPTLTADIIRDNLAALNEIVDELAELLCSDDPDFRQAVRDSLRERQRALGVEFQGDHSVKAQLRLLGPKNHEPPP